MGIYTISQDLISMPMWLILKQVFLEEPIAFFLGIDINLYG